MFHAAHEAEIEHFFTTQGLFCGKSDRLLAILRAWAWLALAAGVVLAIGLSSGQQLALGHDATLQAIRKILQQPEGRVACASLFKQSRGQISPSRLMPAELCSGPRKQMGVYVKDLG